MLPSTVPGSAPPPRQPRTHAGRAAHDFVASYNSVLIAFTVYPNITNTNANDTIACSSVMRRISEPVTVTSDVW